ncbi:MAG: hypothetical protein DCC65_09850 [Planctomycetota bacterium]|nr:MAG: hypothetical protein DCC65_09850 [Planctomycetota bacterium]
MRPKWFWCILVAATIASGNRAGAQNTAIPNAGRAGAPPETTYPATTAPATLARELDENLSLIKGNNTPEARKLGASRLLEAGTDDSVGRLIALLVDEKADLPAQIAVCQAIAESESPPVTLVDPLLSLLGDARPGLVEAVGQAIRKYDSALVVGKLRPIALTASGPRARRLAAIRALGQLGDEIQAIAVLAGLFKDEDRVVRMAAFNAFSEATGVADPQAASDWYESRKSKSGLEWLRAIIEARSQQVARLKAEKSELTRRLVAAYRESYLTTPEPGRPKYLQSLLSDTLPSVRLLGLDLVNDLITDRKEINPETKGIIAELTLDPDARVRLRAARTVGDLRLGSAVTKLNEAQSREIDDDVRAAQVNALGRLDDITVMPSLVDRLSDDSLIVVGEAATALGTTLRRGQQNGAALDAAVPVIIERYKALPPDATETREKFLVAMTSIGAQRFRPIFEQHIEKSEPVRIQRAAISGLAAYEDAKAAERIRPLTTSTDPEIRMVAVTALGKCGGSEEDLSTLANLLLAEREPEPAIRQHAWDAYISVAQRLRPDVQVRISDQFDRADDKTAQRRRLELLRSLRADTVKFDSLTRDGKIDILERMADAQLELGEFTAASASLEQAMGLFPDQSSDRYASLAQRSVAALLAGKEDAAAIKRIGELFDGQQINGELRDAGPLADIIRGTIRARTAAALDATGYAESRGLIDAAGSLARIVGPDFERELAVLRDELIAKRSGDVDRLLTAIATDPEAEAKLFQHGRQAVLPKVYERLLEPPTTSAPAAEVEKRLVRLAKRLAPSWQGIETDATETQRRESLKALKETIDAARPENGTAANQI